MRAHLLIVTFLLGLIPAVAETSNSALKALKVLPKGDAANVARIEGPDGSPVPERWYILVYSASAENGLKEFVVAKGELVAARQVSQFAESLTPEDVVGTQKILTDSDKLAKLTTDYARANNLNVAALNYHFGKEGAEARPVWRVSCLDEKGQTVGTLVATADKGKVVSHEGFAVEPSASGSKSRPLKLKPEARPQVAEAVHNPSGSEAPPPIAEEPNGQSDRSRGAEQRGRSRATTPEPANTVRDITRPIRRTIGRLFPF